MKFCNRLTIWEITASASYLYHEKIHSMSVEITRWRSDEMMKRWDNEVISSKDNEWWIKFEESIKDFVSCLTIILQILFQKAHFILCFNFMTLIRLEMSVQMTFEVSNAIKMLWLMQRYSTYSMTKLTDYVIEAAWIHIERISTAKQQMFEC